MIWTFNLLLVIALVATLVLQAGLERAERAECMQWQQMVKSNSLFYATDWQIEQCLHYEIDLNN